MSQKPIFVVTHPRACSTAFERVFMTQRDSLTCVHEPFGDAFYYGPERLSERFADDEKGRMDSGFSNSTYKTIFDRFERESFEGKRLLIKDMAYYIVPPNGQSATVAPSLARIESGVGTNGDTPETQAARPTVAKTEVASINPTIFPEDILQQFHYAFLIRHPRSSVPSYYRCTIPPLDKVTGFFNYMPSEAGYVETRRMFDYLRSTGQIGPKIVGQNGSAAEDGTATRSTPKDGVDICVVDADDLLDNPSGIIETFCKAVGISYDSSMLTWDKEEDHKYARETFEKWTGFHDDAINSTALRPRAHKHQTKSREQEDAEWEEKYGAEGAKVIGETVEANINDYEYLKQFAMKI